MNTWKVEYNNDTGPNDEGFWEWYQVGPARIDIARHHDPASRDQAKKDANLIAAAPDLYAALKAFVEAWDKSHQLEKR